MAWTKAKTALAVGVMALLTLSVGSIAVYQYTTRSASSENFEGAWEGSLKLGEAELRLVAKLKLATNGTYVAVLDSIDQGASGIPVTSVTTRGRTGRFELKALSATFEGQLSADKTEWVGKWTQIGRELPLTLKRSAATPTVASTAPQDFAPRKGSDLQGYWIGALSVKGNTLRLALKIAKLPSGKFNAMLDSLDQGAKDIPTSRATYTAPHVRLEWGGFSAVYDGQLEQGVLKGTWQQGAMKLPLEFRRDKVVEAKTAER